MTTTTEVREAIATILTGLRSAEPDCAFVILRLAPQNVSDVFLAAPDDADPISVLASAVAVIDDEIDNQMGPT